MRKNLAPLSFSITLFVGLAGAFGVSRSVSHEPPIAEIRQPVRADFHRRTAEPVEVWFNDFVNADGDVFAEFRITNFSDVPYYYLTYDADMRQRDKSLLMEIEVGGKKIDSRWCGTGLLTKELGPGVTIYSRVSWAYLSYNYKKGKSIRIGFSLSSQKPSVADIVWSDLLPIKRETEKALLKEKQRLQERRND